MYHLQPKKKMVRYNDLPFHHFCLIASGQFYTGFHGPSIPFVSTCRKLGFGTSPVKTVSNACSKAPLQVPSNYPANTNTLDSTIIFCTLDTHVLDNCACKVVSLSPSPCLVCISNPLSLLPITMLPRCHSHIFTHYLGMPRDTSW